MVDEFFGRILPHNADLIVLFIDNSVLISAVMSFGEVGWLTLFVNVIPGTVVLAAIASMSYVQSVVASTAFSL